MKRITLALVLLLLLSACGTPAADGLPAADGPPAATESTEPTEAAVSETHEAYTLGALTTEQMLEDYEFLWQTLRECYPFMGVAERQGVPVDDVYEEYRARVEAGEAQWHGEFLALLDEMVREFKGTGHFSMVSVWYFSNRVSLMKDYLDDPKAGAAIYQYNVLTEENTYNTYIALGADLSAQSDYVNPERAGHMLRTRELYGQKIAIVNMSVFDGDMERDAQMLTEFYAENADSDHLIIDITGNPGGGTMYWEKVLVEPLLGEDISWKTHWLFSGSERVTGYLDAGGNWGERQPISELPDFPALLEGDLEHLDYFLIRNKTLSPAENSTPFEGRIWVLVDEVVYSAAEDFAVFCKSTGFATIVGTQTGGDGIGLTALMVPLPNSGLVFQFSPVYGINPDGSNNEEFGTTPDIVSPEGETPLNTCMKEIQRLAG